MTEKANKPERVPVYLTISQEGEEAEDGKHPRCVKCGEPMLIGHRVNTKKDAWKFVPVPFPPVEMLSKRLTVGGRNDRVYYLRRFAHAECA